MLGNVVARCFKYMQSRGVLSLCMMASPQRSDKTLVGFAGLTGGGRQRFIPLHSVNEPSAGFRTRSQLSLAFTTAYCFEGPDFKV